MRVSPAKRDDRYTVTPIVMGDGWSGRVLTRAADQASRGRAQPAPPAPEQWQAVFKQLAADPTALPGYSPLKYSRDIQIFRAQPVVGDVSFDVVFKQTRVRGAIRRIASRFRNTREHSNFRRALDVLSVGINTARPLALFERRRPTPEAWLVTEYVPDLNDLDLIAMRLLTTLDRRRAPSVKKAIIRAIVELLASLEQHRLAHRDLKASNILLKGWDKPAEATLWLLDLDGLSRRRTLSRARRAQPLMRLAASLLGYAAVTRTDYVRFLRQYLEHTGQPSDAWRRAYADLARQALDYVRRSRQRKSDKLDGYHDDI